MLTSKTPNRFSAHFIVICIALAAAGFAARAEEASEQAPAAPRRNFALYDQGRYVYETNCVVCHGTLGDGRGEMAASLSIKPRSFKDGLFKYRSTPWGKLPTTEDLERTVRNGITGTAMGMFSFLSDSDLRAVVEYIKFFSRKWRKAENYAPAVSLPPSPGWLANDAERERHASRGRETFQSICAACHGAEGDGKGSAAAALRDDLGEPAPPADLRQPHLRCGDDPENIFRVLVTGLNGTSMVSFVDALSEQQRWDLAAFILTLRSDFNRTKR
jgi:cytochrome c oxidase cbb3-type subunit I/II